jgi:hypothetical protein
LRGPEQIPLAEELALTRRYLEIEALRFGDRLRLHWDIPETMPEVLVPSLSIQPLAENAIRHGIERRPDGGAVDVAVRLFADRVEITVANDMPGTRVVAVAMRSGWRPRASACMRSPMVADASSRASRTAVTSPACTCRWRSETIARAPERRR